MNCGVGLSLGLATVALIRSLAWEPPYAAREALKSKMEKEKKKREREKKEKRKNSVDYVFLLLFTLYLPLRFS